MEKNLQNSAIPRGELGPLVPNPQGLSLAELSRK
jgi:hypothetical protein